MKMYIGGVYVGEVESIKISEPGFLILLSHEPLVIVKTTDKSEVNRRNILGHITGNKIEFIKRPKLSLADYTFLVLNAQRIDFDINNETECSIYT